MLLLRCYPKITDWIYEVFNHAPAADYRFLPIFSYGFWVAMGFFAAATLATIELKRREKLGLLKPVKEEEIIIGLPPNMIELTIYTLVGFVFGFKILGIIAWQPQLAVDYANGGSFTLKAYMLSAKGSWLAGLALAAIAGGLYYRQRKMGNLLLAAMTGDPRHPQRKKEQPSTPVKQKVMVYPSAGMGDLVVIAAILGVFGSILFNFLESPGGYSKFWEDPVGFLTSGLSVYGGLICAGIGFAVYAWRKKIHFGHFFDSIAPGFILANGLGRIGCQVSGDGDWGLVNEATKPGFMPQWLWADNYAHNIVNEGVPIPGCIGDHCMQLAKPVYPTPLYEFLMCTAIFLILWGLRKRLTSMPGLIFTLFMVLIGIQRYAIEQWRDLSGRDTYKFFGMAFRQSELISITLFIIGVVASVYLYRRYKMLRKTV